LKPVSLLTSKQFLGGLGVARVRFSLFLLGGTAGACAFSGRANVRSRACGGAQNRVVACQRFAFRACGARIGANGPCAIRFPTNVHVFLGVRGECPCARGNWEALSWRG